MRDTDRDSTARTLIYMYKYLQREIQALLRAGLNPKQTRGLNTHNEEEEEEEDYQACCHGYGAQTLQEKEEVTEKATNPR